MDIQAAVARAGETGFRIETLQMGPLGAGEVRVRIAGVGLCHTDLQMRATGEGWYPFPAVFGHEGAGVVEAVGDGVSRVAVGDAVVASFRACGVCRPCGRAEPAGCEAMLALNFSGRRADGTTALSDGEGPVSSHFFGQSSFASHATVHESALVKVDDCPDLALLGPLGCGVQTGAGAIMHSHGARAGDGLLVMGGGSVGLSAVMAGAIVGCAPIIVLEPHAARRALALELGASHVLDPAATPDLAAAVRAIVPRGVDHVFDTTGRTALLVAAMGCLARRGTLGLVAGSAAEGALPLDCMGLVGQGQRVIGIIEGDSDPQIFIPELLAHYRAGRLPFDRMIRTYPLVEINTAIADHHAGVVVKAVLIPGQ
ncbi:MAG: NAD(P)-dependent alcohol dehydrogenase [Polymorphobacter sp.]|uniref:NAD(P)-dependent alcohol dehydrogenase n=1 Tax=Polymorphobacter sp. TaxID=1909290 RepID=UPI003A87C377